jgi:serine protease AprX
MAAPLVGATVPAAAAAHGGTTTRVVVRGQSGAASAVRAAIIAQGGRVTLDLPIIDGVAAEVPSTVLARLEHSPGVVSVSADVSGEVTAVDPALGYDTGTDQGSLDQVTTLIGARSVWSKYGTGQGVDIALIDTGVTPQTGLKLGANVINGPDLSFDSQVSGLGFKDGFGHGTHMASIIAGRDGDGSATSALTAHTFSGVAPGARIVNIKVGAGDGTADVSQVIAAVSWVTQHAHDPGLNIRVLNLSFGTSSTQYYTSDPLAFAADVAWRKGVMVVVAGGNDGTARPFLANPALNPDLLAVGAEDPNGTASTADDTVPSYSQRGNDQRHVDVVAPGAHVLGLRVPGGKVDAAYPGSRVGTRFTRGSGTSQAAAVVSGAAALMFGAKSTLTPDQVKWLLMNKATPLAKATTLTQGNGLINVSAALGAASTAPTQATLTVSMASVSGGGYGSVEATRGSGHVSLDGVQLVGEKDIFGKAWDATKFTTQIAAGTAWSGGSFLGTVMTGAGWTDANNWTSRTWVDNSWTSRTWVSENWNSRTWVDSTWTGDAWLGGPWASGSWS